MDAGRLNQRVTFQAYVMIETDMGGVVEGWEDRFALWAHLRYLRGSEAVMQARLVSKAPVIITVRRSARSERITSEWRAVVGSVIFDLKEDPRPSEDGGFFEMLAEA
ncbi:head-tail adaptor protein [Paracoccus aeridis]|uniref:head-tail adaptor protein n=1 Tax=Paracoccus aeridis TaxID=1966466 RepID=UPI0010AB1E38|nr:head-tail adaptor protein [Paracoccus aeridis]